MNNEWRDGFLFLGNHLLLDFLNTLPVMEGEAVEMLSDGPALARWLGAAGLVDKRTTARLAHRWAAPEFATGIEELRRFRESVRETVLKMEEGDAVSPSVLRNLNRLLISHPDIDQVIQAGSHLERHRHFSPEIPQHAFAPLADAFADLLTAAPRSRIRKCNSCVLHFCDTSKKGTRVWCSMNICGNRAKVAAFAERKRAAAEKVRRGTHKREVSENV